MNKYELTSLIERYLDKEMTAEEIAAFKKLLANERIVIKEYIFQKDIRKMLAMFEIIKIKAAVREARSVYHSIHSRNNVCA